MADVQTTFAEISWEIALRSLESEQESRGSGQFDDIEQESLRLATIVGRAYKEIIAELNRKED